MISTDNQLLNMSFRFFQLGFPFCQLILCIAMLLFSHFRPRKRFFQQQKLAVCFFVFCLRFLQKLNREILVPEFNVHLVQYQFSFHHVNGSNTSFQEIDFCLNLVALFDFVVEH